jgi:tagatose-1,6-bisphosphate aldolase
MAAAHPPSAARLGKLRRLQRISDSDGYIRVAAIDHPENYLALFDPDISRVGFGEVVESKLELIAAMAAEASAVLVDPVWSFGQGVLTGTVPADVGIISGLEQLAYSAAGFGTETVVREHWTVPLLLRLGADAAKLVVFHREELAEVSAHQTALVGEIVAQCDQAELPLVVEPLWYPLAGEDVADPGVQRDRVAAMLRSVRHFADLGPDIMKVEFPGSIGDPDAAAEACAALDASVSVPWVLLSASATHEQFRAQLAIAAGAGACGFMAGRAIWGDAVGRHDATRRAEGARTAVRRLAELHEVLAAHGHGWSARVSIADAVTQLPPTWHETY